MSVLSELLFPPKCVGCGQLLDWVTPKKGAFCTSCASVWSSEKRETCGICAKAVSECLCATEAMQKAGCEGFCKAVYYLHGKTSPPQNRLIFYIKRNRTKRVFDFLAEELLLGVELMLKETQTEPSDVVFTYVPRRLSTRLEYGVDQAKAFAEELSKKTSIPMQTLFYRSNRYVKAQKHLNRADRFREVKNAYGLLDGVDVKGKTVILTDDTVTTGATMASCIRLLKKAGAKRVLCVSAAVDDINREREEKTTDVSNR